MPRKALGPSNRGIRMTLDEYLNEIETWGVRAAPIREAWALATAAERERCAKIAEKEYDRVYAMALDGGPEEVAERIAAAIVGGVDENHGDG
jgi:hypothetical protein